MHRREASARSRAREALVNNDRASRNYFRGTRRRLLSFPRLALPRLILDLPLIAHTYYMYNTLRTPAIDRVSLAAEILRRREFLASMVFC